MGSKGASREVAKGVQPETASQRLGLSASGAGGQTSQVTSTRFCSGEWTSSGPKSNLEGGLVRGGRSASTSILLPPFLNFVYHSKYQFISAEIIILLIIFVLAGIIVSLFLSYDSSVTRAIIYSLLLALFYDIQFDGMMARPLAFFATGVLFLIIYLFRNYASTIFLTVFGAINVATVVLAIGSSIVQFRGVVEDEIPLNQDLPIIVHLVLDEFIGLDGIPTDSSGGREIRGELLTFFQEYGFHIFGRAYAQYFDSKDSIPTIVNFKTDSTQVGLLDHGNLTTNTYFSRMHARGYSIRVYQSTALDFCS